MNIDSLVKKLLEAKDAYYNDQPIMSDSEFDMLEDELKDTDPDNMYFSIVGTSVKGSNKIKHEIPMLSCGKAKTYEEVLSWLKKINCEEDALCVEPKIDGLSATIKYVNGKLSYISTRGDGEIGQDITYLKDYLNIPKTLPMNNVIEIRGEIYLPKDTKFNLDNKPLRNVAVGLVNRKSNREDCKYLRFTAYQVLGIVFDSVSLSLEWLKKYFDTVDYIMAYNSNLQTTYDLYTNQLRNEWKFETDGLVVFIDRTDKHEKIDSQYTISHHHFYNIAWKPEAEGAETTLLGIDWDVSKNGNIIPVANFEPIILGSRVVQNATLNNFENVEKLNLHIGDKLFIILANEVIPFVQNVTHVSEDSTNLIPKICPSCGATLVRHGVHIRCNNKDCPIKNIKLITDYCSDCEMDGVSQQTIAILYNLNFIFSVVDLYSLHERKDKLLLIDGFGESKVNNLLKQIEKSKNQNIVQFISRLGIESLGEKGVMKLGIKTVNDFINFVRFNGSGGTSVNGKNLINFLKANEYFILTMISIIKPTDLKEGTDTLGEKVCMTGKGPLGRKELIEIIEQKGFTYTDTVNKETNILICEDPTSNSSKLQKASKLGVKLISYEDFFKET